jgi:hypothetical protein
MCRRISAGTPSSDARGGSVSDGIGYPISIARLSVCVEGLASVEGGNAAKGDGDSGFF